MPAVLLVFGLPLAFFGGVAGLALGLAVARHRSDWIGLAAVPVLMTLGGAALPVTVIALAAWLLASA